MQGSSKLRQKFTTREIEDALNRHDGCINKAAQDLGVMRRTLSNWVRKEGFIKKDGDKPKTKLKIKPKNKKRFVITSCQNNAPLHYGFIKTLENYCNHNNAQLIVIPIRYKNVTAYIKKEDFQIEWPEELIKYYLNDDLLINDNLCILADLKTQATALSPLSGLGAIAGHRSAIIGHGQIQMKLIPTPQHEFPRILLTTGSCSLPHYSSSKAGKRAKFHHSIGATLVETDGDLFCLRQINANMDGSFYELDKFYKPDGSIEEGVRADGLVCGDIHSDFIDPQVVEATWTGSGSICNVTKPKNQYVHDVLDFYSALHHHRNNFYTRFAKHHAQRHNVQEELDRLVNLHNKLWTDPDQVVHYIDSNHNNAFTRWLNEADPRQDLENALFYHQMQIQMLEGTRLTDNGVEHPNPLELYVKDKILNPEKTHFHDRGDKVLLHDIDLSQHGDIGANGSRGTVNQFAKSGYKAVIGHSHTPAIEKGTYQVGTSSRLKLEYNQGYSSWLHCHCLIYPNGKRTLITVVNGKWRL